MFALTGYSCPMPKAFLSFRDHRQTQPIIVVLQSHSPSYLLKWVADKVL